MRRLVKFIQQKLSVVELESTNLALTMNKLVITRSFFSNRGVKPTVREATQNSSHLEGRLGSIVVFYEGYLPMIVT